MEVLEREVEDERGLCVGMMEKKIFFFFLELWGAGYRARLCRYRHEPCAPLCQMKVLIGLRQARPCHHRHGACQTFWSRHQFFFLFLHRFWTNTYKTNDNNK